MPCEDRLLAERREDTGQCLDVYAGLDEILVRRQLLDVTGREAVDGRELERAADDRYQRARRPLRSRRHQGIESLELGADADQRVERRLTLVLRGVPGCHPGFVGFLERRDEGLLVGLRVVNERRQPVEAELSEPVVDDVDRGALLADEQDSLAARDVVGDEVRDRLRLAGPRRPLDDEARPLARARP